MRWEESGGTGYLTGSPVFEDSADSLIIWNLQVTTDFYC